MRELTRGTLQKGESPVSTGPFESTATGTRTRLVEWRRPRSADSVQERWGFTVTWAAGLIVEVIAGTDIDETRAAAERLAQERG